MSELPGLGDESSVLSADDGEHRPALYVVDRTGHVAAWSHGAEELKGYASGQAMGMAASAFYLPTDRANAIPESELIAAIGGQETFEGWRVRRDGTRFRAEVQITHLYAGNGHVSGFVKVTREILSSSSSALTTEARSLSETLRSVSLHLQALHTIVEAPRAETPEQVVAKLTVLEWRLARLEEVLRQAMIASISDRRATAKS